MQGCPFEGWPNKAWPSHPFGQKLADELNWLCPFRVSYQKDTLAGLQCSAQNCFQTIKVVKRYHYLSEKFVNSSSELLLKFKESIKYFLAKSEEDRLCSFVCPPSIKSKSFSDYQRGKKVPLFVIK